MPRIGYKPGIGLDIAQTFAYLSSFRALLGVGEEGGDGAALLLTKIELKQKPSFTYFRKSFLYHFFKKVMKSHAASIFKGRSSFLLKNSFAELYESIFVSTLTPNLVSIVSLNPASELYHCSKCWSNNSSQGLTLYKGRAGGRGGGGWRIGNILD